MIRIADYIMERLAKEGIESIFMVTGRGMLYLSDAVARSLSMEGVSVHHEQAAAYAAMSYAKYKDQMGACLVSTGCAGTNTLTGVLCAWQDDVPCVFISGQNKLKETTNYTHYPIRTFGNQEADIVTLVKPITKYAVMITNPNEIAYEMDKAFYYANEGRKGPVWIDVPLDVQNMRVEEEELKRFIPDEKMTYQPNPEDILYVKQALEKSKRPVLMIGSGVRTSNGIAELYNVINRYHIPVVFDNAAVDICGAEYPLSMGTVASIGGSRAGNFTVQNSDCLLVIGSRLSPVTTGEEFHKFAREAVKIVVDIDENEHKKNTVQIDYFIHSDAKEFLIALDKQELTLPIQEWRTTCSRWKSIFPKCEDRYKKSELVDMHHLAECLEKVLPQNAVVLTDAGLEELIFPSVISFKQGQRCIHPASQGAMGVALPAAIGVGKATNNMIVSINGDGSVMMNLQELQTILYQKLPVKVFVINNNCYAVIRHRQEELFRNRTIGTDINNGISCPDFQKIAEGFQIPYMKIESSNNLEEELTKVLSTEGAVLCEIMAVEDQGYISNSFVKTKEKRFAQRPIEDQAPFLDREVFLAEMIVEPIDQ